MRKMKNHQYAICKIIVVFSMVTCVQICTELRYVMYVSTYNQRHEIVNFLEVHARLHYSKEQCKVLSEIGNNVVFMCFGCLQVLPVALEHYENTIFVDSRITTIEQSVTDSMFRV